MSTDVMLFEKTLENIIRMRLQEQGCTRIRTVLHDQYIEIYLSNEKYVMYLADGIFYANDQDVAGEFDYYVGNKVLTTSGKDDWEFQPNNTQVDWNAIRFTEGILRLAYIHASSILYKGKINIMEKEQRNRYVSKYGIDVVRTIMEKQLIKIFQVSNEKDDQEFSIYAYPDYSDDNGTRIIIYIQIGYPERGDTNYPLACDDLSFFLTIDMVRMYCFISTDFPWVQKPKNLFDTKPQTPDNDWFPIDVWTAIKIMTYNTMMLASKNTQNLFVAKESQIGLESDSQKVEVFAKKLLDKLILEFPLSKKGEIYRQSIQFMSYPNGITRFYTGIFVIDIAVDTCGLVDIGLIYNMGKVDGWDFIWKTSYSVTDEDNHYVSLNNNRKVICYSDLSTESRVIVEEASKIIQAMMFQIDEIVIAEKEGSNL